MKFCLAVLEEYGIRDWEGRTDGRMDGHKDHYIPSQTCGGYDKYEVNKDVELIEELFYLVISVILFDNVQCFIFA